MSLAGYVDIVLMVSGGLILVTAVSIVATRRRRWKAALAFVPVRSRHLDLMHVAVVMLLFILALGGFNALGRTIAPPEGLSQAQWVGDSDSPGLWFIIASNAAKLLVVVIVCLTVAVVVEGGLTAFGFRGGRIRRDLIWAVPAYLVVWPICAGLAKLFVLQFGNPPTHGVLGLVRSGAVPTWGVVALWIGAVGISPLAEEVFFRGLLQTVIRGYVDRPWLAIGIASVLFGLMHYSQPQYVLPLAVLGAVLGYVYEHTGSLVAPVLIHILFNARTMILDLLIRST